MSSIQNNSTPDSPSPVDDRKMVGETKTPWQDAVRYGSTAAGGSVLGGILGGPLGAIIGAAASGIIMGAFATRHQKK